MPSYTISKEPVDEADLRNIYKQIKQITPYFDYTDLDIIFEVALHHRDRFPGINFKGINSIPAYLTRWVSDYRNAYDNPPSSRRDKPKSACSDPAIKKIVKMTQGISEKQSIAQEHFHNLFMSAENVQGNLLEEYIAIMTRPYGWIWCTGNTLWAIDFCSSDGHVFLQIKNKSNTENSSSSNIRQGTFIQKWYRLGTSSRKGIKMPSYKWAGLNEIINNHRTAGLNLQPCNMNEDHYIRFLSNSATKNPQMITAE